MNLIARLRDQAVGDEMVNARALEASLFHFELPEVGFQLRPMLLIQRIVVFELEARAVEDIVADEIECGKGFRLPFKDAKMV
jgi:hypothetical protein